MASLNHVVLIGNLGRDPETRYLQDGKAVTNFSIATSESWTDKGSGEKQERTEWHRIQTWGKLAEVCGEYLKKGSQVCIVGKIQTRKWTDKDGVEKYTTEIVASEMKMLGSRGGNGGDRSGPPAEGSRERPAQQQQQTKKPAGKFDDMEDDIPF